MYLMYKPSLWGWTVMVQSCLPRCSSAFQPSGPRRCQFTTSQCAAAVWVGSQRTRDWFAKFGTAPSRDKRPTLSIPSILEVVRIEEVQFSTVRLTNGFSV